MRGNGWSNTKVWFFAFDLVDRYIVSITYRIRPPVLPPFKNQLTLSVMLVLSRRFPLFLLSPPTESNGLVYYAIHTSEFRRTSSKGIIARSIIIILELKPTVIVTGMQIISKINTERLRKDSIFDKFPIFCSLLCLSEIFRF